MPNKSNGAGLKAASDIELALALVERAAAGDAIHVTRSEGRAERLAAAARALLPSGNVLHLPGWDCLPYDRVSPSPGIMGARLEVLQQLPRHRSPRLLILSLDAALQRLPAEPPPPVSVTIGDAVDIDQLADRLRHMGYIDHDMVEAPGELALRGQVLDLYPAWPHWSGKISGRCACRIEHEDGRVTALRCFDPVTQRSAEEELDSVVLGAASELVPPAGESVVRVPGIEHALPDYVPDLLPVFQLLPKASVSLDPEVEGLRAEREVELADSFRSRLATWRPDSGSCEPVEPARFYLHDAAWRDALTGRTAPVRAISSEPLPDLASGDDPEQEAAALAAQAARAGRRVLLMLTREQARGVLRALARETDVASPVEATDWPAFRTLPAGSVATLRVGVGTWMPGGLSSADFLLITGTDLVGAEAAGAPDPRIIVPRLGETGLQPGDAVVHWDHGVGALRGVEPVETGAGHKDCLRLEFARGAQLLVPFDEMDQLWRYGGEADGVALDHLGTESWAARRASVEAHVADTAKQLAILVRAREKASAPVLKPASGYRRLEAGFGFHCTRDQEQAIEHVLADLASGRPMDRLVCGDVGFGKTEVAIRAAAVAALAGYQVAILAPTTILARQHLETFRARFAGTGIRIEGLSRLTGCADARAIKAGIASGAVRIAVGTHALAARGIRFAKLGLLIVDEEQRFGARQKTMLRRMRDGVHVLTMTATPIPRTLQTALVGLQDLSIIATPPAHRQPIRTETMPFDETVLREALLRERRRGGASFVVCPRIEDIATMRARLAALVPDHRLAEAHGDMAPAAVDDAVLGFANGDSDILLATNIVDTGLDVPRANTMIVWQADRFGLSQLHQLRGRVGRGRRRGAIYLMTDPMRPPSIGATNRLRTLEALDQIGAGFAVSARDLDLRGAGELLGETQAGHVRLIGLELYQHLLTDAIARSRGKRPAAAQRVEVRIEHAAFIPPGYVPEDRVRVNLLTRLSGLVRGGKASALDALEEELRDRFGPLPDPMTALLDHARLRIEARRLGITRLEVGPEGAAASFNAECPEAPEPLERKNDRLLLRRHAASPEQALATARILLSSLARTRRRGSARPVLVKTSAA